ncbi:MAG: transcriptional repressor NrdR [Deltaproteobacteria bacterium]|nr:transcriptional repressor NrdR [Deltaproteobacteria bacterium]
MRCPYCLANEDKVVDTRPSEDEQMIRRRRECNACGRRFTTYERVEEAMPMVVKKDARREPYERKKLLGGLHKACEKRPVSPDLIDLVADEIERSLRELGDKEIPSSKIGDAVLSRLRDIDDVAYLRFASVYLPFKDAGDLMHEVQRLIRSKAEGF